MGVVVPSPPPPAAPAPPNVGGGSSSAGAAAPADDAHNSAGIIVGGGAAGLRQRAAQMLPAALRPAPLAAAEQHVDRLAIVCRRVDTMKFACRAVAVLGALMVAAPLVMAAAAVSETLAIGVVAAVVCASYFLSCHLDLLLRLFRNFVLYCIGPFFMWLWETLGPFWATVAVFVLCALLASLLSRFVIVVVAAVAQLAVLEWVDPRNVDPPPDRRPASLRPHTD